MVNLVEEVLAAFALSPEVLRDELLLVRSWFLFSGPGSKLRHEKGENSGLLGGPSSFLWESQQRFLPYPSPLTSPAVVQTGRESLPACFLELAGFG